MDKRRKGKKTEAAITLEDNFMETAAPVPEPVDRPDESKNKPRARGKVNPLTANAAAKSKLAVVIDILSDDECSTNTRLLAVKHLKEIYDIL